MERARALPAIERELEKKGVQLESHLDDIVRTCAWHEHGHEGMNVTAE